MTKLRVLQAELVACKKCKKMKRPVVHGPPILSPVLLIGQAPGPREGALGRPFAWTAGKTLFQWLHAASGASEGRIRNCVYFAAVARCFPGKMPPTKKGPNKGKTNGDRRPDQKEIANCKPWLAREVELLEPELVIAVGTLAIEQVLGEKLKLEEIVGRVVTTKYFGREVDVVALPHPSGASPWHKMDPGKSLLARALQKLRAHPAMISALRA